MIDWIVKGGKDWVWVFYLGALAFKEFYKY